MIIPQLGWHYCVLQFEGDPFCSVHVAETLVCFDHAPASSACFTQTLALPDCASQFVLGDDCASHLWMNPVPKSAISVLPSVASVFGTVISPSASIVSAPK